MSRWSLLGAFIVGYKANESIYSAGVVWREEHSHCGKIRTAITTTAMTLTTLILIQSDNHMHSKLSCAFIRSHSLTFILHYSSLIDYTCCHSHYSLLSDKFMHSFTIYIPFSLQMLMHSLTIYISFSLMLLMQHSQYTFLFTPVVHAFIHYIHFFFTRVAHAFTHYIHSFFFPVVHTFYVQILLYIVICLIMRYGRLSFFLPFLFVYHKYLYISCSF